MPNHKPSQRLSFRGVCTVRNWDNWRDSGRSCKERRLESPGRRTAWFLHTGGRGGSAGEVGSAAWLAGHILRHISQITSQPIRTSIYLDENLRWYPLPANHRQGKRPCAAEHFVDASGGSIGYCARSKLSTRPSNTSSLSPLQVPAAEPQSRSISRRAAS